MTKDRLIELMKQHSVFGMLYVKDREHGHFIVDGHLWLEGLASRLEEIPASDSVQQTVSSSPETGTESANRTD